MVPDEAFDGESVFFVVPEVEAVGFFLGEGEVGLEVFVYVGVI